MSLEGIEIDQNVVRSVRDVVLESLREAIINGHFKPGDHLSERELAERMGVSTTPIKEAFRVLEYEGLVNCVARKGTYVSDNVESLIKEVLLVRASLDGFAAKFAAMKASDEQIATLEKHLNTMRKLSEDKDKEALYEANSQFHNLIIEMCQNPMLANILKTIYSFNTALRKRALIYDEGIDKVFLDHKGIVEAISERQPETAEQRMKDHIYRSVQEVMKAAVSSSK